MISKLPKKKRKENNEFGSVPKCVCRQGKKKKKKIDTFSKQIKTMRNGELELLKIPCTSKCAGKGQLEVSKTGDWEKGC